MSKADVVRSYIEAYRDGDVMSCEDLAIRHQQYTVQQIYNFMHTTKVYTYLSDRNIPAPPKQKSRRSLTDRQRDWLAICTNPYTAKKITHLCAEFGITPEVHALWMQQAHFKREYERLMKQRIAGSEGEVFRRVASKAVLEGDVKSVETLYRMTGKPLAAPSIGGSGGTVPIEDVLRAMQQICAPEQLAAISAILLTGSQPQAALPLPSQEDV